MLLHHILALFAISFDIGDGGGRFWTLSSLNLSHVTDPNRQASRHARG